MRLFPLLKGEREVWADRSLSALLVLQIVAIFVSAPLADLGLSLADWLALFTIPALFAVALTITPTRRAAVGLVVLVVAHLAAVVLRPAQPDTVEALALAVTGLVLYGYVTWVIAKAVFGPGPATRNKIGGAIVIYFNIALVFTVVYRLLDTLLPGSFHGLTAGDGFQQKTDTLVYFSIVTLSTTGFGDIVPVSPMARSLASLEAVAGQLYIVMFLGRLITLNTERHARRAAGGRDFG